MRLLLVCGSSKTFLTFLRQNLLVDLHNIALIASLDRLSHVCAIESDHHHLVQVTLNLELGRRGNNILYRLNENSERDNTQTDYQIKSPGLENSLSLPLFHLKKNFLHHPHALCCEGFAIYIFRVPKHVLIQISRKRASPPHVHRVYS